ncbi:MAG: hypothetical protein R3190_10245, partial [Thermoanaerobaculia bacterium]|nr:hypothetical protein [Thermoanaerobaculia bacterium]
RFDLGTATGRRISIAIEERGSAGRCGSFRGSAIVLYGFTEASGRVVRCTAPERNLAHELGHALGLSDAGAGLGCRTRIMAPIGADNGRRRRVEADECQLVGQLWLTSEEVGRLGAAGGLARVRPLESLP